MIDCGNLVEGYLTGIKVHQKEKKANLFLQETTGQNWVLTAIDVSELMVLQMCMQNIIDRISFWSSSNNDSDYRSKIFSLVCGKFAEEGDDLYLPSINKAVEMIQRGDALLIELEPVYGALVLILARDMSIAKE